MDVDRIPALIEQADPPDGHDDDTGPPWTWLDDDPDICHGSSAC